MKKERTLGIVSIAFAFAITICMPSMAETVVVVHPDNTSAGSTDMAAVQKIFLGKSKKYPDGTIAVPLNQEVGSGPRGEFDSTVLHKTASQLKAYWSKLVFTGKGTPPKTVANDAEVIALVSKNPSLIGYIDKASVDGRVKALTMH
ncbi:MAG: phosphate ABC transporter substrate-binding protein [Pseudomonadales bacterium]|nr:phosphate ABC transporter substrate-binding protein [Pseudomonadales bacterium]